MCVIHMYELEHQISISSCQEPTSGSIFRFVFFLLLGVFGYLGLRRTNLPDTAAASDSTFSQSVPTPRSFPLMSGWGRSQR